MSTLPQFSLLGEPDGVQPAYRAMLLLADHTVAGTVPLSVANDEEAVSAVRAMASELAIELWDGLRFIEHFEGR